MCEAVLGVLLAAVRSEWVVVEDRVGSGLEPLYIDSVMGAW